MKVIHILLILIFILFAILGIKVYNSNKEPEYTILDIQEILDKAYDVKNYECEINDGNIKYYKRKDYKLYMETETGAHIIDYVNNTHITTNIDKNNNKYYIENTPSTEYIISSNSYTGISGNDILSIEGLEIINIKEEKYNENSCLKVKFKITREIPTWLQKDDGKSSESAVVTIWINIDNGLIMKIKGEETGEMREFTYKFNTVTDEDVTPDLTGYKKIVVNN